MNFILLATALFPLIGGPSTGKTTIINALKEAGEVIVTEAATDFIAAEQAKGNPAPWLLPNFEARLFDERILREEQGKFLAQQQQKSFVFIDRGLLDTVIYLDTLGQQNTSQATYIYQQIENLNPSARYTACFFIEPYNGSEFQLIPSPVRKETTEEALFLADLTKNTYTAAGLPIISVPPYLTPKERALFVLKKAHEITAALEN